MNSTTERTKMVPGTVYSISIPRRRKINMQRAFSFAIIAIVISVISIISLPIKSEGIEDGNKVEPVSNHNTVVIEEPELPNDTNLNFEEEGPIGNIIMAIPVRNVSDTEYIDPWEDISMDYDIKEYIHNAALSADIPPAIMFSLAWCESRFDPSAVSETNDHGLFQINEINFSYLAKKLGLSIAELTASIKDPYINTDCAVILLTECRDNYNNSTWHQVLMRYNMGPGGASEHFKNGEYTSAYSRSIMEYAEENFGFTDVELK